MHFILEKLVEQLLNPPVYDLSIAPAVIGLGLCALKLGGSIFGNKAKKEQQKEQVAAQQRQLDAARGAHDSTESQRLARQQGIQAFLKGLGTIGGVNYAMDPAAFANMNTATPFSGAMGADPRKGGGAAFLSGLLGQAGDIGIDIATAGGMGGKGATPAVNPEIAAAESMIDPRLRPTTGATRSGYGGRGPGR